MDGRRHSLGSEQPVRIRNNATRVRLALLGLLVMQACTGTPVLKTDTLPALSVEGMVIRNELVYPVTDVMINVPETGAFAGCGNIMPRTDCRTSFESVGYNGNAMVVNWSEYGQKHSTKDFVIEPGADIDIQKPAWLEVTIFSSGQAGAKFIQDE